MEYSQKGIFSGSTIYAIGQLMTKGSAFLLIPLYTRFLSPSDYGVIGYLGVYLQFGATVLLLGFRGAQQRSVLKFDRDERTVGVYLTSTVGFLAAVGVGTVLILNRVGPDLYERIGGDGIAFDPLIRLTLWTALLQGANQLVIGYFLTLRRYVLTAALQIGLFLCMTASVIYFVVIDGGGALGQVRGLLWGNGVFLLVVAIPYLRKFRLGFEVAHIRFALGFGLPIVVHLLSGTLLTMADRLILERMVPMAQLGIYTLAYQIGIILNVMNLSMNNAWQPSYYLEMGRPSEATEERIGSTYRLYAVVLTLGSVVGVILGPLLYDLFTPSGYEGGARVIGFVILGYFFNGFYFFSGSPIFFFGRTRILPVVTGISAVVNVVLNLILIPFMGILGAALATAASFLLQYLMIDRAARRIHDHSFDRAIVIRGGILLLVATLTLSRLTGWTYLIACCFLLLAAVGLIRWTLPREWYQLGTLLRARMRATG